MGSMFVLTFAVSFCGQVSFGQETSASATATPGRFRVDDHEARPILAGPVESVRVAPSREVPHVTPATVRQRSSRASTARWADVDDQKVVRQSEDWRLRWRNSDPANRRTVRKTAEASKPITFETSQPQSSVQPAFAVSRPAGQVESTSQVQTIRFNEPRRLRDDEQPAANPVRFASQQDPSDPFSDPFGDRNLPLPAERTSDEPAIIEPPRVPPAAGRDGFEPAEPAIDPLRRRDSFDSQLPPLTGQDSPFDPSPFDATPDMDDPAPQPPASEDQPGDRKYNRRDCCAAGKECDEHRQRVQKSPIREISLDISPRMTVTQLDRTNYDSERQNTMRRVPPRAWKNDAGEVLADGRMTNFRYGMVEIETEDGLKKIPFSDLSDDDMCFFTAWWSIPSECSLGNEPLVERNWVASTMTFKASSLCHKPLYFEDVNLERYGHTAGPLVQPVLSGAHFFVNVAALPYKMGINPPTECRYPLGYYRPGDCAPWLVRPVPLSIRGGLTAAATYVGGTFVIP